MLAEHPIDVMLTATDMGEVRRFYGDRIGLKVLIETEDFVTFGCGGDSRLVVTRSSALSGEQQTKASWRVKDVAAEVAELRARGVDPGGNTIGLLQFKGQGLG
jgi:extradiol dioxygenase family protein